MLYHNKTHVQIALRFVLEPPIFEQNFSILSSIVTKLAKRLFFAVGLFILPDVYTSIELLYVSPSLLEIMDDSIIALL